MQNSAGYGDLRRPAFSECGVDRWNLVFLPLLQRMALIMPLREPKMLTVGAIIVIGYCALELLGPVAWAWVKSW
jgi:hypothetical protein